MEQLLTASPLHKKSDLSGINLDAVKLEGRYAKVKFQHSNFSNCRFTNSLLSEMNARKSNFDGCVFDSAKLSSVDFDGSTFKDTRMQTCTISYCSFMQTEFNGAKFIQSSFDSGTLCGADLSGAEFQDCQFTSVEFDGSTKFPDGFGIPDGLTWVGSGADPRMKAKATELSASAPISVSEFVDSLRKHCDASKLKKSIEMLKAERFQLFCDLTDNKTEGVIKSQTDEKLLYACRLSSDGAFSCCTQNLVQCGGLRGNPCKHILTLLIGLAQAEAIDPQQALVWCLLSTGQSPALNKDEMAAIFLRYQGAHSGEIDWRPMETIPEDFYSLCP